MLLPRIETLGDIDDVERFVVMCIKRSGAGVLPHEWQDMIAEGLAILYKMYGDYDEGRNVDGGSDFKFSGYAIRYMPKKIKESWHRSHEEHLQRTQDDGKRRWEYHKKAISWDLLIAVQDDTETHLDERTIRTAGNFIDPPSIDPRRVRTDAEDRTA